MTNQWPNKSCHWQRKIHICSKWLLNVNRTTINCPWVPSTSHEIRLTPCWNIRKLLSHQWACTLWTHNPQGLRQTHGLQLESKCHNFSWQLHCRCWPGVHRAQWPPEAYRCWWGPWMTLTDAVVHLGGAWPVVDVLPHGLLQQLFQGNWWPRFGSCLSRWKRKRLWKRLGYRQCFQNRKQANQQNPVKVVSDHGAAKQLTSLEGAIRFTGQRWYIMASNSKKWSCFIYQLNNILSQTS